MIYFLVWPPGSEINLGLGRSLEINSLTRSKKKIKFEDSLARKKANEWILHSELKKLLVRPNTGASKSKFAQGTVLQIVNYATLNKILNTKFVVSKLIKRIKIVVLTFSIIYTEEITYVWLKFSILNYSP